MKLLEVLRSPSYIYIFLEYCNEGDLSTILSNNGAFTEEEALCILK